MKHTVLFFTVLSFLTLPAITIGQTQTDPKTGQTGEALPLMGMGNHFGADVVLPGKGEHQFQVGSKLADGSKRQFTFHHTLK